MLLEADEDLLQVIEGAHEVSGPIRQIRSPPPVLDGRLHEALVYLLDIRVHYGPTLWAAADGGAEPHNLESWEEEAQGDHSGVWRTKEELDGYWEAVANMKRVMLTITHQVH